MVFVFSVVEKVTRLQAVPFSPTRLIRPRIMLALFVWYSSLLVTALPLLLPLPLPLPLLLALHP